MSVRAEREQQGERGVRVMNVPASQIARGTREQSGTAKREEQESGWDERWI